MQPLAGKTVLLTGASKGIGAATARALGEADAHLLAHYGSDEAGARAATSAIPNERKMLVKADLSRPEGAAELWRQAVAWRGRVDVLVNNAGVMIDTALGAEDGIWDQAWAAMLEVNVLSPARLIRDAVRHYREYGGGILITVSSWVAHRGSGNPNLSGYAASKAALKAFTQTIARTHAKEGVLAYVIAPGVVRTRMSKIAAAGMGGEEAVTASLAMGEWVPPEEVAELVAFLATGRSRHLTGATIDVNGASYIR